MIMTLAVAVALPVGFALGQVVRGGDDLVTTPAERDETPNDSAVGAFAEMNNAFSRGDNAALETASEAVTAEIVKRLEPEERSAYESAPPAPDVPPGTYAYVAEEITPGQLAACNEEAQRTGAESKLCELITLHAEGELRAGAFSAQEVAQAVDAGPDQGGSE